MNPHLLNMKDIQSERDYRSIPIDKVGIKNLNYPITVLDRRNKIQHNTESENDIENDC